MCNPEKKRRIICIKAGISVRFEWYNPETRAWGDNIRIGLFKWLPCLEESHSANQPHEDFRRNFMIMLLYPGIDFNTVHDDRRNPERCPGDGSFIITELEPSSTNLYIFFIIPYPR